MTIGNQPAGQRERAADRRVRALELRKLGLSYRAIASQLGVGKSQVHTDIETALAELAREQHHAAESLRALELARLDDYLLAVAPQIKAGDLGAVDRAIRLSESRRKLLGLDAPAKIAPTDPTGEEPYAGYGDDALRAEVAAILADGAGAGGPGGDDPP